MKNQLKNFAFKLTGVALVAATSLLVSGAAHAQSPDQKNMMMQLAKKLPVPPPAGVFGVYMIPKAGKGIFHIGYTHVSVEGLIQGTNDVSASSIASTVANPFFGAPGQPPFQRIIPTELKVDVLKIAGQYSVTDRIAIAGLVPLIRKEMDAVTFAGPAGSVVLGTSNNVAQGIGDIKLGALVRLYDDPVNHILFNSILSIPTGSITKSGTVLNPAGIRVPTRLFYGMQLGSGTWDPALGMTYWGRKDKIGWGTQYLGTFRGVFGMNKNGWRFGDKHELTAYASYAATPRLTFSVRAKGTTEGRIKGMDPLVFGPATGADPNNYGGEKLELFGGINFMPKMGSNLSPEVGIPVYQNRNGVQGNHKWTVNASWRMIF